MNNPNDDKSYREHQESYTDSNGNTHVKRTSETVNNSTPSNYQSGYVHGQATERSYQEQRLAQQDEDSTSRGLIIGFLLALVGLIGGAFWYFNQNNTTSDTTVTPTAAPVVPATSPTPIPTVTQPGQVQTQIIERTKEVQVPVTKEVPVPVPVTKEVPVPVIVPQQAAPKTTTTTPNINITVPPQTSTTKPTSTQTAPSPSSNSSTTTKETTSGSSSTTTPESSSENTPASSQETSPTDVTPSNGATNSN
ncbi:hypothetical protein NIES4071_87340 [Calothrix sp. NIES-4071]|nr:hypothetical protein NIES4071_87340 [Calothrix sp. NIES-4071]BAZ63001.1 hypothetical protein NIES4105_87270 [Calothrix sp. NIES-4105]